MDRPVVVQKYGGSSVATLDRILGVAGRVKRTRDAGFHVVVVVSAMGTTTDQLIALARGVSARPERRELDMLLSVGERITMALLAMALRDLGVPAVSLTGSQSGIVTDEAHADAKVIEVRPERLLKTLSADQVAIVAGFQGVSREREVTTLGRGGSDTTAVVLAAALGARWCEICSDVDGVYSADPRVVGEALKLDELSLDEALALARGGAKVLFEDAVRYARDHGVALHAASTFGPGSGTRLAPGRAVGSRVVAVTADVLAVVELGASEGAAPDRLADLEALTRAGARIRRRLGDRLYLDLRNLHGGLPAVRGAVGDGVALVTAVGSALGERALACEQALAALAGAGHHPTRWGAEGDTVWVELPPAEAEGAVRVLHRVLQPAGDAPSAPT